MGRYIYKLLIEATKNGLFYDPATKALPLTPFSSLVATKKFPFFFYRAPKTVFLLVVKPFFCGFPYLPLYLLILFSCLLTSSIAQFIRQLGLLRMPVHTLL